MNLPGTCPLADVQKLPNRLSCKRRLILTYDEEKTINDKHGTIEVMPVWKWLLAEGRDNNGYCSKTREPFFCSFFLVLFGDVELITYFCQPKE